MEIGCLIGSETTSTGFCIFGGSAGTNGCVDEDDGDSDCEGSD